MLAHPPDTPRKRAGTTSCRLVVTCVCAWVAVSCAGSFTGNEPAIPEYQAKATLIRHLVEMASWPDESFAGPESPLVVGVLGPDPFGPRLDTLLADVTHRGRPVALERYAGIDQLRPCHLLFVTEPLAAQLDEVSSAVSGLNVLTVGESRGFARGGGMVELGVWRGRIRLALDTQAANAEGLTLPAAWVALAAPITRDE